MRLIDDGIVKVNNYLRCGKKSHKNILVNIQMQKQKITAHTPIKLPHGETGYIQKHKDTLAKQDRNKDNIYLVLQFFIHPDEKRNKELLYCLKQNVRLGLFNKIYLLNERIYTAEEMGLTPEEEKKVKQVNVGSRLKFMNIFQKTKEFNLNGYVVFCNSDIFFDKTILNLRRSILSVSPSFYTQLRFEFNGETRLAKCNLFGPRYDSQDTWIFHTKFLPKKSVWKQADFEFGRLGCDNKIAFVLASNGHACYNEPWTIKTYHYHTSAIRNYSLRDRIPGPYVAVVPVLFKQSSFNKGIFGNLEMYNLTDL